MIIYEPPKKLLVALTLHNDVMKYCRGLYMYSTYSASSSDDSASGKGAVLNISPSWLRRAPLVNSFEPRESYIRVFIHYKRFTKFILYTKYPFCIDTMMAEYEPFCNFVPMHFRKSFISSLLLPSGPTLGTGEGTFECSTFDGFERFGDAELFALDSSFLRRIFCIREMAEVSVSTLGGSGWICSRSESAATQICVSSISDLIWLHLFLGRLRARVFFLACMADRISLRFILDD